MVYYYTSGNIKMLRNVLIDYSASKEVSPYEYMKGYIQKFPENTEDAKISWIAETFLGIQRHAAFLNTIALHLSEELSEEDQNYFVIVFHAIIFQINSKDMQNLYKCLFNLSKPLLNTFTKFLGNNEILTFILHVAQSNYDANYVTDKIIAPLFIWQPYISEMGHSYSEYVKKVERRKMKPPTVPIQPNVLNRRSKESASSVPPRTSLPATPPNSLHVKTNRKMLTKSAIDQRLKNTHEKNKQKAANLLNDVKKKNFHFAQDKSDKYYEKISSIRNEMEHEFTKPYFKPKQKYLIKHNALPVKDNAVTLKRLNKRIQLTEQNEVQWLQDLMKSCKKSGNLDELEEFDRQKRERERLCDIEKKHLVGQISHEEALIAKKKLQEDNKKKYEEFMKEKETWNEQIEKWKKMEMERNRKQVEKMSMLELNLLQAKNGVTTKKKEIVEKMKKESETLMEQAMKNKQEELEKRINMIKEIKILAMIAKKAQVPKIVDLTETSGFGFLCEMSMAELQERLNIMKIGLKEELERKRQQIKEENTAAKQELEDTKSSIKTFLSERAIIRKQNKKPCVTIESSTSKEIINLKKILEDKRKLRMQLTQKD